MLKFKCPKNFFPKSVLLKWGASYMRSNRVTNLGKLDAMLYFGVNPSKRSQTEDKITRPTARVRSLWPAA